MTIEQLILANEGTIVDVRTPDEFMGGCVNGSVNIPLQEIGYRMEEVNELPKPLILCCASGGRSGVAHAMLSAQGIDCHNAGSWLTVNHISSLTK
jgi:rhodanese-related sulfurtransferase